MLRSVLTILLITKLSKSYEVNTSQNLEDFSNCGGDYSGYKYTIISPNYPNNYPKEIECIYNLRGSSHAKCNQIFNIQFLDFSLVPSENCHGDYLEIGDRSVFCGNVGGIRRYPAIKDNTLTIRFRSSNKSNNGAVGKGFKIEVTTLPCPSIELNSTLSQLSTDNPDDDVPGVEPLTESPAAPQAVHNIYPVYRPPSPFIIEESESGSLESVNTSSLSENFLPPTHNFKLFSTNTTQKLPLNPTKISAYFFAPPDTETSSSFISPLPVEQLPPTDQGILFKANPNSVAIDLPDNQLAAQRNEKIGSYGLPLDIKTGEVLDNTRLIDCVGNTNIAGVTSSNYAFRPINSYPAVTYGQPGLPSPPTAGFVPTLNPANYFPGTSLGQCCSNVYAAPRSLLTSPGFPTLIYSGNSYQCGYTIAPYASNVCRLRLNFKFFNLGTDDSFCSAGFLEIDGRRYCGCKTGLSIVSNVPNLLVKTIAVRYVGLPRTKLNGFVIEVIQERCSYNGYPYSYRRKKDVGNATFIEDDEEEVEDSRIQEESEDHNATRVKRNFGYTYPKPSISFNPGGVGHIGASNSAKCQALSLIDWTLAAKEVYLKSARCLASGGSPNYPNYPGNSGPIYPGTNIPGYPGNNIPGYPGNNIPGYPGNNIPSYPGNNVPGYPGNNVPGYPGYPGNNVPGFPGTNVPGYPGNNYPGFPGTNIPNYPGNNIPGYPGINIPNYPGPGNRPPGPGYLPPSNTLPQTCETISVTQGILSSPFYPSPYPNNANKCWRFYRSPVACRLELLFQDFDVEPSQGCIKDYLTISGQNTRYCGRTLAGSKTLLGFPSNNIIDIRFITDNFGSGKGFSVAFAQIPCQVEVNR